METKPTMVEVEKIDYYDEGGAYPASLMIGTGRVIGTQQRVTFVGDPRAMAAMAAHLKVNGTERNIPVAVIEPWQVMSWNAGAVH